MNRDLPKLHHDVVFGRSGGRIIWQPRIGCWYGDKIFEGEPLPEPYTGLSLEDIYRKLGCSHRLYGWYNRCFKCIEHPSVKRTERKINDRDTETVIDTPVGKQIAITRTTLSSSRQMHVKREIETEEELKVAAWREENNTWEWDEQTYRRSLNEVGDLGAPTMYLPRMNLQCLYIEKMGVERAIYALHDWPDAMEAFFRAREESHDRLIDIINPSPIDITNFGENVHAGTLPPDLFLRFHKDASLRRGERLRAAGKFVTSHWDGDCRPLFPYARDCGLDGIEAITPFPQGDVTLEETREALGDDMFLLDGIPAIYFDDTFGEDVLTECVHRLIELFAPKLVLGISDELSSTGDIERIRTVGQIVDDYNAQFD